MTTMIDLHCHILPGIDDGAPDLETSLNLARQAVDDGITHIVATPHFRYPVDFAAQLSARHAAANTLRKALANAGMPLTLSEGGEFQICENALGLLRQFPNIGYPAINDDGTPRAVLVELLPQSDVLRGGDFLFQAQLAEDSPQIIVVAHPERQPGFVEHASQLATLLDRGLHLQFNATAFVQPFWHLGQSQVTRTALSLMAHAPDQVYLASDAHDPVMRPCRLSIAHKPIAHALGEDFWEKLTRDNPKQLLGNS